MSNTPNVPMDDIHLVNYARNAARELVPAGKVSVGRLRRRLKDHIAVVERASRGLWERKGEVAGAPPAVEWLLDNGYLALRAGREALMSLDKGRPLRGTEAGDCLLWRCAQSLLWAQPDLERERVERYLEAFQTVCPLTERELSLLVSALTAAALERLAGLCQDVEALRRGEGDPREFETLFTGLRSLEGINWGPILERASRVEAILRRDPSGDYPHMAEETRRRYRQKVCRLAEQYRLEETQTARRAVELAEKGEGPRRHVGWYLFCRPLGREKRLPTGAVYLWCVCGFSLLGAWAVAYRAGVPGLALLLLVPMSDVVKNTLDFLLLKLTRPRAVPRMALEGGIPRQGRTLCVVVSLLTGADSAPELAALLERYRLANRDAGEELRFGILADLPDSDTPMGETGRAWLEEAREAVEALNRKYGGGFYLFFRQPRFNPRDERYMGWERKRGALLQLVRLLMDRPTGLTVEAGDGEALRGTRFIITLDGDTRLNVGTARELVGAMLHPLNQPELDRERNVVVSGYGLLQPRVTVDLKAANRSFFSRVFAGTGGVDPYGSTASDLYHDLFDQGSYTGKGIFQVDVFFDCLDGRFPENSILSHDLLEGSYLRAGLIGDVELTDGCPWKVLSYFVRLHRWIRGDWQLLLWLLGRTPDGRGGREKNPLTPLARWKLFDNLRRSLVPIFTLAALLLGLCGRERAFGWAGGVALLAAASGLLLSGPGLAARGRGAHRRYHSTVIAGLAGAVLQTALQLLLLPYHAFVAASAVVTALWRMGVTHRKLLAWVTAAQAERGRNTLWRTFLAMWPSVAVGLFTLVCARLRLGMAVGFLWMLAPALAWAMSQPDGDREKLPAAGRAFLLHEAGLIWGYFAHFLRPEDHWLPPDNWQEQPGPVLARRTSPTNIGLALLSAMAAADLELVSRRRAVELISHILDTAEALEKWRGHLYNWYDTASLRPLRPRYVSTVDSGNLRGCLIALGVGLEEWGQGELASRARALADAMDCAPLYDRERKLFSIGYEVERDRRTDGYYDLMASEARQTSYIAVAKGEVEPRHWRRLGRMLLGDNGYSGMASWTGTMFEYFMPALLLPCEPNSFFYETLSFCIYAQKRRGAGTGTPWGISESGFYAFDPALNYQYKAHGVQALGLKRGLDRELVVAPYATFLALLLAPRSALSNLRRLRDMGLEGRYGFYEAVDYTAARLPAGMEYEVVRSYMSHHLGMSLVALDNALQDNIMQRRFMADEEMGAYRELLQERMPVGEPVTRKREREVPEKLRPAEGPNLERTGEGGHVRYPHCHLVSNGSWSVLVRDNGVTYSTLGGVGITLARPEEACAPSGVSFFFRGEQGVLGLTPAPLYQSQGSCRWRFDADEAQWTMELGALTARTTLSVPRRENGELRQVELSWQGDQALKGELLAYLEPVLCPMEEFEAHPAFSRLFLSGEEVQGRVLFRRRVRQGSPGPVLAVAWEKGKARLWLDRSAALGRGGLRALEGWTGEGEAGRAGVDPCLLLAIPIEIRPGETRSFSLALAVGDRDGDAAETAEKILRGGERGSLTPLVRRLSLTEEQTFGGLELLERLVWSPGEADRPPQSALWPFGVSGDLPIAAGQVADREEVERTLLWCRWHRLLTLSGYPFDLVLLVEEGGDYRRPIRSAILEGLKVLGAETALGAKGGVHLVPREGEETVLAWAAAVLPLASENFGEQEENYLLPPVKLRREPAPWKGEKGSVTIQTGERLPPVGWSQLLCNDGFGWLTDETGGGLLWSGGNAREHKLTPWPNDPLAVGGPERMLVETGGQRVSLFADGDGLPCAVTYGPGFARWEKELPGGRLTTWAYVPKDSPRRMLTLLLTGNRGQVSVWLAGRRMAAHELEPGCPLTLETVPGDGEPTYRFIPGQEENLFRETLDWWRGRVSALEVSTPDPALDRYLGGWCLYQVIACRMMARTSQYQNGGAYGFRDQLQDVAALLWTWPERTREQLLLAASRQFEEGDVQHWWHPPLGAGVRTRISDDLLWLPWVLCRYCTATGDWGVLEESVPYLTAPPLADGERERYEVPAVSTRRDTLYRHALAAIQRVLDRGAGDHGLAKMGTGDWNDGMDRVGAGGRGESVWLTWFLTVVLQDFAPLCRRMGEEELAQALLEQRETYLSAAHQAWDGAWYRRGYYDDGTPLGSAENRRCQIDSIAQSFAALPQGSDRERAGQGVSAALHRLFDRERQVVRLFDPPFDGGEERDPGYIRGYPAGVRENGGQYTHGAVWLALALFRLERGSEGWEVLRALLPEHHPTQEYGAEPYVIAADVSYAPGREGRAGWSWYTGAAGWYWQVAVGELLGLKLREGRLFVEPKLPQDWPGYQLRWRLPGGQLLIRVRRTGAASQTLDGSPVHGGVPLKTLQGEHQLEVTI